MLATLFMLAALQSTPAPLGLRVEELPSGQFRIIVTRRGPDADPGALGDAMLRVEMETRSEAAHHCADRGGPVAVDRGYINMLPQHRWETVQTFACRVPAAPPPGATPPAGS
jgi:hypothetical protein